MAAKTFQFKHFTVSHQRSSMPVGTDAVLLGAWACHPSPTRVLDVGCGCGILALMAAQRFAQAKVDAIDIDRDSVLEATENFTNSHYASRLNATMVNVKEWQPGYKYDLIISNPPYFQGDVLPDKPTRVTARHEVALTHETLLFSVDKLLLETGAFCCVLPESTIKQFIKIAEFYKLVINKVTYIQHTYNKPPSICLLSFGRKPHMLEINQLNLHTESGKPTNEYLKLIADFYTRS